MTTIALSPYYHVADLRACYSDSIASSKTIKVKTLSELPFPKLFQLISKDTFLSKIPLSISFTGNNFELVSLSEGLEFWLAYYLRDNYHPKLEVETVFKNRDLSDIQNTENFSTQIGISDPKRDTSIFLTPCKQGLRQNLLAYPFSINNNISYSIEIKGSGGSFFQPLLSVLKTYFKDLFHPLVSPLLLDMLFEGISSSDIYSSREYYGYFYPNKILSECLDIVSTSSENYVEYVKVLKQLLATNKLSDEKELKENFNFYFIGDKV